MKKTLNTLSTRYKLVKANPNVDNLEKSLNNSDKEQKGNSNTKTYKMHPLNYWSGPHFLFHINIPSNG